MLPYVRKRRRKESSPRKSTEKEGKGREGRRKETAGNTPARGTAGNTLVRIKIKRLEREKERKIGTKEGVVRRKEGTGTGMVQGRIQDYLRLVERRNPGTEKEGGVSENVKHKASRGEILLGAFGSLSTRKARKMPSKPGPSRTLGEGRVPGSGRGEKEGKGHTALEKWLLTGSAIKGEWPMLDPGGEVGGGHGREQKRPEQEGNSEGEVGAQVASKEETVGKAHSRKS